MDPFGFWTLVASLLAIGATMLFAGLVLRNVFLTSGGAGVLALGLALGTSASLFFPAGALV